MSELGTAPALLLDVLLIIVTMSALAWRESRWSRRVFARQRRRAASARGPRAERS